MEYIVAGMHQLPDRVVNDEIFLVLRIVCCANLLQ